MKIKTAADLQMFAHTSITALCEFPHRSETSVYKELSDYSSLSTSTIRHFHKGGQTNLTASSLDRLVASVKHALRLAAAE